MDSLYKIHTFATDLLNFTNDYHSLQNKYISTLATLTDTHKENEQLKQEIVGLKLRPMIDFPQTNICFPKLYTIGLPHIDKINAALLPLNFTITREFKGTGGLIFFGMIYLPDFKKEDFITIQGLEPAIKPKDLRCVCDAWESALCSCTISNLLQNQAKVPDLYHRIIPIKRVIVYFTSVEYEHLAEIDEKKIGCEIIQLIYDGYKLATCDKNNKSIKRMYELVVTADSFLC